MLTRIVTAWVLSAAALAAAAALLGTHMSIGTEGDPMADRLLTLAVVAALFTLVNQFVAPVVKAVSLPFIILTLGLALLVINALLLLLTEWLTSEVGVAFEIDGFWWALVASVVISLVNAVLGAFTRNA